MQGTIYFSLANPILFHPNNGDIFLLRYDSLETVLYLFKEQGDLAVEENYLWCYVH